MTTEKLTIEETEPSFAYDHMDAVCEFILQCHVCGEDQSFVVGDISDEEEGAASREAYEEGWRNASWPGHTGIACPKCIKRGTVDYY